MTSLWSLCKYTYTTTTKKKISWINLKLVELILFLLYDITWCIEWWWWWWFFKKIRSPLKIFPYFHGWIVDNNSSNGVVCVCVCVLLYHLWKICILLCIIRGCEPYNPENLIKIIVFVSFHMYIYVRYVNIHENRDDIRVYSSRKFMLILK